MFRGGVLVLAACALSSVAACSLLLGEGYTDPDVKDPSSTPVGDGGTDAVAAPSDAASNDADAGALDGGGEGGLGCPKGTVSFCDDFERQDPLGAWTTNTGSGSGSVKITSSSAGRRLDSAIAAAGDSAGLEKSFALTPAHVRFAVTIEVAAYPTFGPVYMAGVLLFPDATETAPSVLYVYSEPGGIFFVQQRTNAPTSYRRDTLTVPLGAPHRIAVDATFGGSITVSVDGVEQLNRATESFLVTGALRASVGAASIDGQGYGFQMFADDFAIAAD